MNTTKEAQVKKILLIGGCGYLGSAIHNRLSLSGNYHVETVDLEWFGNYSNDKNLKVDFKTLDKNYLDQFDVVVHTAAHSSVPLCRDIHASFENNVSNVLALVKKLDRQKFIYASSSCVYVESMDKPKEETEVSVPMDGLTLSKTTLDFALPLLGVEYYGLRFGSVNGWSPNMRTDLMINAMTLSAIDQGRVNIFNGFAQRPIVSTWDLSRAIVAIIESDVDRRGIYNVASFNSTVAEIGTAVAKKMQVPLVDGGVTGTYDFTISSEKFKHAFNFTFESTVDSIVDGIITMPRNAAWGKRDAI